MRKGVVTLQLRSNQPDEVPTVIPTSARVKIEIGAGQGFRETL